MSATLALIAALLWLIAANLIGMLPSRDHHWSNASKLIAVACPILIWLWASNSWLFALAFAAAAGSVLRWPLIYLGRRLRKILG